MHVCLCCVVTIYLIDSGNRKITALDGSPRQRYGNVYYHLNLSCITTKQPHFNPTRLVVSQELVEEARQAHSDYLKIIL